ncbi:hypothetical protein CH063_02954 [Colletotrichum higginsianum]|uniref:Uncharacterized protein n=2 Tax=Colletotrichum higginsianum TaxID=80884 RepID=H1VRS7_COLHI|nr:hypothetical protein CH63R_01571 [Colletotrichum higginsianum IMI 349063]OBR16391.1 hypothetical protein CH63R_01571 [Colletotrichum higginsianum IMI 349063]TID04932.1 hypothetical protein CH35J_001917 [Colletotrichum higginsianum]CCF42933.1 hypothetical protein CH063_02954 [Colletotrichum higginsianum]
MRYSTILSSLATLCTVSALPLSLFLPVGNLPAQPTTGTLVLKGLGAVDGAILALTDSLNRLNFSTDNAGNSNANLPQILEKAIGYQIATQTARLDAQGVRANLSSDDSLAIVNKLTNDIIPHLRTATELLSKAKSSNILGISTTLGGLLGSIRAPLGLVNYFDLIRTDTAGLITALLPFIDSTVQDQALSLADVINNLLNATFTLYSN